MFPEKHIKNAAILWEAFDLPILSISQLVMGIAISSLGFSTLVRDAAPLKNSVTVFLLALAYVYIKWVCGWAIGRMERRRGTGGSADAAKVFVALMFFSDTAMLVWAILSATGTVTSALAVLPILSAVLSLVSMSAYIYELGARGAGAVVWLSLLAVIAVTVLASLVSTDVFD